jgi:hypothetical protein
MGTFHQHKHQLHGITVVVATAGPEVYVGRCDDIDDDRVILLDADAHRDGDDGRSNEEWVRRAAEYGVWPRHRRVVLPREEVSSVRRLGEV